MILGFSDYQAQGRRLAEALGTSYAEVVVHRFPDGESKVTIPTGLPQRVTFCRSLDRPNDKLVELLLAAATAREQGARHLTLVAPYLCYMRQDVAFHPGEAVSQRVVGRFLAELFDAVITVDPHLHRIEHLEQAIPATAVALSSAPALRRFLRSQVNDPLLLGPDEESRQWVRAIAEPAGLEYAVARKERRGDRDVDIRLPTFEVRGRTVVLVDDMVSTGRTLISVARALQAAGVGALHCLITHPLFADDAGDSLRAAGIETIWSSDSIAHESNAVALAPLLAEAIRNLD